MFQPHHHHQSQKCQFKTEEKENKIQIKNLNIEYLNEEKKNKFTKDNHKITPKFFLVCGDGEILQVYLF